MEVVVGTWGNKLVAPDHPRHALMHDVQLGDIIFHWVGKNNENRLAPGLYGYSTVAGVLQTDTGVWKDEKANEIVLANYVTFDTPIYLNDIRVYSAEILNSLMDIKDSTKQTPHFPFQKHEGFGVKPNQRYLSKFPKSLVSVMPELNFLMENEKPNSTSPTKYNDPNILHAGLFEPALERVLGESALNQTFVHYERKGYKVTKAADGLPYDLVATRDSDERHVVISWSLEAVERIIVKRSVTEHANVFRQTDLAIVESIQWNRNSDGSITAGKGFLTIQNRWQPAPERLRPMTYEYTINL